MNLAVPGPVPGLVANEGASFSRAVAPHRAKMAAVARRILDCSDHAQDAVQEALVALWQEGETPSHTRPWLVRAVLHRSLHARRTAGRRRKWEERAGEHWLGSCPICNPEEALEARQEQERISVAMRALSDDLRLVLRLRTEEGLSYQEIAERLEIPIGTVRSRLNRAKRFLQERLREPGRMELPGDERRLLVNEFARGSVVPRGKENGPPRPLKEDPMKDKAVRAARFGGRVLRDRRGAALAEYGLLVAGIALVAMAAVSVLGSKVSSMVGVVASALPGANPADNNPIAAGRIVETAVTEDGEIQIDGNANSDQHGGVAGESRLQRALGLSSHQMGHLVQDPNAKTPAIGNQ